LLIRKRCAHGTSALRSLLSKPGVDGRFILRIQGVELGVEAANTLTRLSPFTSVDERHAEQTPVLRPFLKQGPRRHYRLWNRVGQDHTVTAVFQGHSQVSCVKARRYSHNEAIRSRAWRDDGGDQVQERPCQPRLPRKHQRPSIPLCAHPLLLPQSMYQGIGIRRPLPLKRPPLRLGRALQREGASDPYALVHALGEKERVGAERYTGPLVFPGEPWLARTLLNLVPVSYTHLRAHETV